MKKIQNLIATTTTITSNISLYIFCTKILNDTLVRTPTGQKKKNIIYLFRILLPFILPKESTWTNCEYSIYPPNSFQFLSFLLAVLPIIFFLNQLYSWHYSFQTVSSHQQAAVLYGKPDSSEGTPIITEPLVMTHYCKPYHRVDVGCGPRHTADYYLSDCHFPCDKSIHGKLYWSGSYIPVYSCPDRTRQDELLIELWNRWEVLENRLHFLLCSKIAIEIPHPTVSRGWWASLALQCAHMQA